MAKSSIFPWRFCAFGIPVSTKSNCNCHPVSNFHVVYRPFRLEGPPIGGHDCGKSSIFPWRFCAFGIPVSTKSSCICPPMSSFNGVYRPFPLERPPIGSRGDPKLAVTSWGNYVIRETVCRNRCPNEVRKTQKHRRNARNRRRRPWILCPRGFEIDSNTPGKLRNLRNGVSKLVPPRGSKEAQTTRKNARSSPPPLLCVPYFLRRGVRVTVFSPGFWTIWVARTVAPPPQRDRNGPKTSRKRQ